MFEITCTLTDLMSPGLYMYGSRVELTLNLIPFSADVAERFHSRKENYFWLRKTEAEDDELVTPRALEWELLIALGRHFSLVACDPLHITALLAVCCIAPSLRYDFSPDRAFLNYLSPHRPDSAINEGNECHPFGIAADSLFNSLSPRATRATARRDVNTHAHLDSNATHNR